MKLMLSQNKIHGLKSDETQKFWGPSLPPGTRSTTRHQLALLIQQSSAAAVIR